MTLGALSGFLIVFFSLIKVNYSSILERIEDIIVSELPKTQISPITKEIIEQIKKIPVIVDDFPKPSTGTLSHSLPLPTIKELEQE